MKQMRIALALLLLVLLIPATVSAQGEQPCFGLAQADCDLYYDLMTNTQTGESFAMAYTFHLLVPEQADITSEGQGHISVVPTAADPLSAFRMDMVTTNTATVEGQTESGPFEFRVIDGNLYLNDGTEWVFTSLATLLESAGLPFLPFSAEMPGGAMGPGDVSEADMAALAEMMGPLAESLGQYVSMARGADLTVAGNTVHAFTTTINLAGIFADPSFTESLGSLAAMGSAMGGEELSQEEMQQMTEMMPMMASMLGMLFANSSLSFTVKAGADYYLYGFAIDFQMTIDPAMMASFSGTQPDPNAKPVDVTFNLDVSITEHNAAFTYTVPAGARQLSPDELGLGM